MAPYSSYNKRIFFATVQFQLFIFSCLGLNISELKLEKAENIGIELYLEKEMSFRFPDKQIITQ